MPHTFSLYEKQNNVAGLNLIMLTRSACKQILLTITEMALSLYNGWVICLEILKEYRFPRFACVVSLMAAICQDDVLI